MGRRTPPPPIFHIVAAREAEFREIADQEGLGYSVLNLEDRSGIVEFRFQAMSDERLMALIGKTPPGVFASLAIVSG